MLGAVLAADILREIVEDSEMRNPPLVTFEEARKNHLREGMSMTPEQVLDLLEEGDRFASTCRRLRSEKNHPVIGMYGRKFWSEEEYLGVPEWARREKRE